MTALYLSLQIDKQIDLWKKSMRNSRRKEQSNCHSYLND
jgi:hypothetical protein